MDADRVLGTDYPFDMGVDDPVVRPDSAGLSPADRDAVAGGGFIRLSGQRLSRGGRLEKAH